MLRNLRGRVTAILLGLSVGPLLLIGVVLSWRSFDVQHQQAIELEREVAHHIADQLSMYIQQRQDELEGLGRIPVIQRQPPEEQEIILSSLLNVQSGYDSLLLLDSTGQEYVHLSRRKIVREDDYEDWSERPAFTVPAREHVVYYGPMWFEEEIGEPLITVAVPYFDRMSGDLACVLVADLRFRVVWGLIADFDVHSGEDVYVLNADQQIVAHRNPSVVLSNTVFEVPEEDGSRRGLNGDRVILATFPVQIGTQTYTVVAERREPEALALAYDLRMIMMVTLAGVFLFTAVIGVWAARQITRPIQQLSATAQAISVGDLSRRSAIRRSDEIGQLAEAFDSMTVQLQRTLHDLEQQIAEQDRTARALRDSEARYRGLFENSPISLWEEDFSAVKAYLDKLQEDGVTDCMAYFDANPDALIACARLVRIVSVNQSTLDLLHAESEAEVEDGLDALLDSYALGVFRAELCALINKQTRFQRESTLRTFSGDTIEVQLSLVVPPGYEDTWGKVLVSLIDITERKLVEQRRLALAVEQKRVEVLQRVISDASHDLRTPLTTIKTHLYLLAHVTDPDKVQRSMDILDRQVARLEDLLSDMLSAAREQRGGSPPRQTIALGMLIEQILDENRHDIARKQQAVEVTIAPDTPTIQGDAVRLRHAIGNVIGNALHFSSRGKRITIDVTHDEATVTIAVQDSGAGISAEILPHIFEPFFRGDLARSSHTGGAGLGLTIAKNVVEAHGGSIEVESTPGEGSVFRIVLRIDGAAEDMEAAE